MHSYYAENKEKFKKSLSQFMQLVKPELEKAGRHYLLSEQNDGQEIGVQSGLGHFCFSAHYAFRRSRTQER